MGDYGNSNSRAGRGAAHALRGVTGADEAMQSRERIEDLGGERCAGEMARPERFELPTSWFVAMRSIQLSYGRTVTAASAGTA